LRHFDEALVLPRGHQQLAGRIEVVVDARLGVGPHLPDDGVDQQAVGQCAVVLGVDLARSELELEPTAAPTTFSSGA